MWFIVLLQIGVVYMFVFKLYAVLVRKLATFCIYLHQKNLAITVSRMLREKLSPKLN